MRPHLVAPLVNIGKIGSITVFSYPLNKHETNSLMLPSPSIRRRRTHRCPSTCSLQRLKKYRRQRTAGTISQPRRSRRHHQRKRAYKNHPPNVRLKADGGALEGAESQSHVVVVRVALQRRLGRVLANRKLICLQSVDTPRYCQDRNLLFVLFSECGRMEAVCTKCCCGAF